MSSWKKASKINQKPHRERHQPSSRASLGILEKKKDYVKRARDYYAKKRRIQKLQELARNRNPDEFYYHMINSKIVNDEHKEFKSKIVTERNEEQKKLMESRSLKYVGMKETMESKKIDKLQSTFHMIDITNSVPRQHIRFDDEAGPSSQSGGQNITTPEEIPNSANLVNLTKGKLESIKRKKQKTYNAIAKRIDREKKLKVIRRKMEMCENLVKHKGMKPKLIKQESKNEAPIYLWKYERKR